MAEADGAVGQRFDELAAAALGPLELLPSALCGLAVQVLGLDGAGVSVLTGPDLSVPLGASDDAAAAAERLQFTLGEGPCLWTSATGQAVLVPDVADPASAGWQDWPTYAQELDRHTPYRALFCFPVHVSGVTMLTLTFYRHAASAALDGAERSAMEEVVRRVGTALLPDVPGTRDGGHQARFVDSPTARSRRAVWIAEGVTMAEHGLSPQEALSWLRSYAYAHDRLVDDVAEDVVDGRLETRELGR